MPKYLLIQNARLVREGKAKPEDVDLLLENTENGHTRRLVAIEKRIAKQTLDGPVTILNVRGNLVAPSFSDLSLCLREPGGMYKESVKETLTAALHGGYRDLLAFYEPNDSFSTEEVLSFWQSLSQNGQFSFGFTAQAFRSDGLLANTDELLSYPNTLLTNRFSVSDNRAILLGAMRACREKGRAFVLFPRVASLVKNGAVNQNIAGGMKLPGLSPVAESLAVAEGIMLAEEAGCRLHVSAISTKKSVSLVREAKKLGLPVTADTSPAHFYFNESEVFYRGTAAKLFPPLREERDRLGVLEGICDGTIDAIASHHTPHSARDYQGKTLADAPFGAVGLEIAFPAAVEALLSSGMISTVRLVELLSIAPRRILGEMGISLPQGHGLTIGDTPDFNILSLDRALYVTKESFHGKATNSPFEGAYLQGRVEAVFRAGVEVMM